MVGRLIFYEDLENCDSKISMGTHYGELLPSFPGVQFKNVIYLKDFQFQRSTFETSVFEEVDNLGVSRVTGRTTIERTSIDLIVNSSLVAYYNSIPSYGFIYLEVFEDLADSSDVSLYKLERAEFTDNTNKKQMTGSITLTFDLIPESKTGCCDDEILVLSEYLAFWDTTNNGAKDLDSEAEFRIASLNGVFWAWQLYFESDGTTPLGSGNVTIDAVGVHKNGDTFTLGQFNGIFGDQLSDNTKWTSTYNIWSYFSLANPIGHGNIVEFSKKTFSFDHGFTGSETTDSAIAIEFHIAVNDSPSEKCTLPEIYSMLTSYCSLRADPLFNDMQQQQVGKTDEQPTLVTYSETRTDLVTTVPAGLTAFSLEFIDTFRKVYFITSNFPNESYSLVNSTTASGLASVQQKSSRASTNLTIAANTLMPISQTEAPISLTLPRSLTVFYRVEQDVGFAITGNVSASGTLFIDGVNMGFLDTSLGNHSISLPDVLPNEDVHTIKFIAPTTGGTWPSNLDISLEFQYRLYRYY